MIDLGKSLSTGEEIVRLMKSKTMDNKLTCAQAHQIAQELQVSLEEVGEKADEQGIKITKCQLGCF